MNISQKCQYAVRALLELAKRYGQPPVRSGEIAAQQVIPPRFLENILNELKTAGLVESHRGAKGGFQLACPPQQLTVGRVIRLIEGPFDPVRCTGDQDNTSCPLRDGCALIDLWSEAKEAIEKVYDSVTFQDLVDREIDLDRRKVANYCI